MHSVTRFTAQTVFRSISHKSQKTTLSRTFAHPRNHIGMFVLCQYYQSLHTANAKCGVILSFICCRFEAV